MRDWDMSERSQTDWARVDVLGDEDIDTSDIPPLDEAFFSTANLRMPDGSTSVAVKLDPETYSWFKSLGAEAEERMRAALRLYAESHKAFSH